MQLSKTTLRSVIGFLTLIILIAMSYFNGQIFLDRILICSFILGLVFIVKMGSSPGNSISNRKKRRI
jgi:hypothetical protein